MSTEEFLLCLRYLISRRGAHRIICQIMHSSLKLQNCAGALKLGEVITEKRFNEFVSDQGIQWRFIVELVCTVDGKIF